MGPKDHGRLKGLFLRALDLPEAERPAFVESVRRESEELGEQLRRLLEAMREPGAGAGLSAAPTGGAEPRITEGIGTRIGPYKLLQRLGEGGFGVVFMAEQERPVRRRVALKIIKLGMDTRAVVARFEQERQALALMDHPNIAKVLDAGATETGRPYFVMELVSGDPITAYCDANNLSIRERLGLFAEVCGAVQHAHQKGLIHRDLKPSNVLVTTLDGRPMAKVIDFGIAKATAARLTDLTLFTELKQLIGTPAYMSPEQAVGSVDIDTRSDVYSLGVLLYELLTGSTPFDPAELREAALAEVQRIIREVEPPRPSLRLSQSHATIGTVAAHRRVEAKRLGVLVRGELDWIVMRAMEKDRARRYGTPSDLAEDVRRHLAGEAVVAAPPSAGYRVRKFVRRNKGAVVGVGMVAGALVVGGVLASWGLWRAELAVARLSEQAKIVERSLVETLGVIEPGVDAELTVAGMGADLADRPAGRLAALAEFAVSGAKQARSANDRLQAQTEAAEWSAYTANLALAQSAMRGGNWPEARKRIAACPPGERGWEWRFLADRAAGSAMVLWGEGGSLERAVVSADGTRIFTPADGGATRVWDSTVVPPVEIGLLPVSLARVESVALSADRSRIALANGPTADLEVWDVRSGERLAAAALPGGGVIYSVAFSPDGTRLVTGSNSDEASVCLWDATTIPPKEIGAAQNESAVASVSFNEDGTRILADGGDGTARVWDATATPLTELAVLRGHRKWVTAGSFSPDGTRVVTAAGYYDRTARLWDIAGGSPRELAVLRGHSYGLGAVSFSPDGARILTASYDLTARLWDARGVCLGEWELPESRNTDLDMSLLTCAFSPDGRFAFVGYNENACIIPVESIAIPQRILLEGKRQVELEVELLLGHQRGAGDGLAWRTAGDGTIEVDIPGRGTPLRLEGASGRVRCGAVSPDGLRVVAALDDRSVNFWEASTGRQAASILLPGRAESVAFAPDGGRLVLTLADGSVLVWDTRDAAEQKAEREARWAEHEPAAAYLEALLAGPGPTEGLREMIVRDEGLTPLRRLVAAEVLAERLEAFGWAADDAFAAITRGQTDKAAVETAARAAELPPRVKAMVVAKAEAWEYVPPRPNVEDRLAEEAEQRRVAEAQSVLLKWARFVAIVQERDIGVSPDEPTGAVAEMQHAADVLEELMGPGDPATVDALIVLGSLGGDPEDDYRRLTRAGEAWAQRTEAPTVRSLWLWTALAEACAETYRYEEAAAWYQRMGAELAGVAEREGSERVLAVVWHGEAPYAAKPKGPVGPSMEEMIVQYAEGLRATDGEVVQRLALEYWVRLLEFWSCVQPDHPYASTKYELPRVLALVEGLVLPGATAARNIGMARYRIGDYAKAHEALVRAAELREQEGVPPQPAELAFLAMTQFRLGEQDQATATLARLRELIESYTWDASGRSSDGVNHEISRGLLAEAEALINTRAPAAPGPR